MPSLPEIKCTGCGACAQCCPRKAVSLLSDSAGFLYPNVDMSLCVQCGMCERACPANKAEESVLSEEGFSPRRAYACIALDEKIRMESSSGGMFSVLAKKVVGDGGVVFGAEFDDDFSVKLGWTDCTEGLGKFRGSKYVQARTEDSFAACKGFLEDGRKVLFTGTPCQVAGLKSFLGREHENLFTADVICHGVPSPALWQKYIKHREKKSASRTVKTAFRRKNDGWKLFSLSFAFVNDSEYRRTLAKDKYLQLFLKDNGLRESCYRCPFRGDSHKADLTLADFWGIEHIMPEFFDDKGTSLVIVQSGKGQNLLDACGADFRCAEIGFEAAVGCNRAYFESPARNRRRNLFYRDFERRSIGFLYRRFGRDSLAKRGVQLAKRIILETVRVAAGEENMQKIKKLIQGGKLKG